MRPEASGAADERVWLMAGDSRTRSAALPLRDERARDAGLTGGKAANLARATDAGLPVLPGFVVLPPGAWTDTALPLPAAWADLVRADEGLPLVVRSSSRHEDTAASSMAGRFLSVLDVRGWAAFAAALGRVRASADGVAPHNGDGPGGDMAVLVQPMLRAVAGGVMFGADPVSGDLEHVVVSAVAGGPDALVDGSTQGDRYVLTRRGRLVTADEASGERVLTGRRLRRLAALSRRTEEVFGAPQDVEFAFDACDRLWLLQARPITAMAERPAPGARLLGPGPVAETFPGVLRPLEEDLWVGPMGHGLAVALDILGAASRRTLRTVPPVRTVGGRVAADLRLLGVVPPEHRFLRLLNPVPPARRLAAAWQIGRLRGTLPLLAVDLVADVDRHLAEYPAPDTMGGGELLAAVGWGRRALSALHAQESLAGALLPAEGATTAAGEALAQLHEGRARGLDDGRLIAERPVLLALFPPSLDAGATLPAAFDWPGAPRGVGSLPEREALRLRVRWVQDMQAAMVRAFGRRLAAVGVLKDASLVAWLRWDELTAIGDGSAVPADLGARAARGQGPELPAEFRLDTQGRAVPVRHAHGGAGAGQGAGGGVGEGTAWDGRGERPERAVLVVRVLDPALAPELPGLAGLVAETGSPLSHLAVLAREHGIPTATAVPEAVVRFPNGVRVTVDGAIGAVAAVAPEGPEDVTWQGTDAPAPTLRGEERR